MVTPEFIRRTFLETQPRTATIELPGSMARETSSELRVSISHRELVRDDGEKLLVVARQVTLQDATSGHEIVAYHEHPGRTAPGHYHVGAGAGIRSAPIQKAHLPVGAWNEPDFIEMLVLDFGIRPLRPDWQAVLAMALT